jgi:hypothetical protein
MATSGLGVVWGNIVLGKRRSSGKRRLGNGHLENCRSTEQILFKQRQFKQTSINKDHIIKEELSKGDLWLIGKSSFDQR